MGIPIASSDSEKLDKAIDILDSMVEGKAEGIVSDRFTTKDLDELKKAAKQAEEGMEQDLASAQAKAAYAVAMLRDAPYTCVGRRFLRVAALNTRAKVVYNRQLVFEAAEESKQE